ncbi:MAG: hypothetical protein R3A44_05010 [Caldilineaceae bacterium]
MPLSTDDLVKQVSEEINFRFDIYSYVNQSKDWPFAQLMIEMLFPSIDSDQAFNLLVPGQQSKMKAGYKDDDNAIYYIIDAYYSDDPTGQPHFGGGVIYSSLDFHKKVHNSESTNVESQNILHHAIQAKKDGYSIISILALFGTLEPDVNQSQYIKKL